MKHLHQSLVASAALLLPFSISCNESPQPVSAPQGSSPHGATAGQPEAKVSGRVVFEGGSIPDGAALFVSVRPKGQKAPWLSRKEVLGNPPIQPDASGVRQMAFELRSRDPMQATFNMNGTHEAPAGMALEVYAVLKDGPAVENKTICDAVDTFMDGKSDYVLTLRLP